MEEKEVFSSNDEFLIMQACTILKENGIPYIRKDDGAGSYINVTYGQNTILEKKIIVSDADFEKARELISFLNEENEIDDIPEELKEVEDDEKTDTRYKRPAKILGWMICIFFAVLIVVWIVQLIKYFK